MVSDERDHLALYLDVLCIQQRQFCLPKMAHLAFTFVVHSQLSRIIIYELHTHLKFVNRLSVFYAQCL